MKLYYLVDKDNTYFNIHTYSFDRYLTIDCLYDNYKYACYLLDLIHGFGYNAVLLKHLDTRLIYVPKF